ncbi:T-complex protein 11-domain-containing protein [Lipomyces japonicus]|uniref:T-complex protein 11-domain-containing protein n=1 Tax=Lipomyces japonicus TaxID=56871 RepID=UPI0034CD0F6C
MENHRHHHHCHPQPDLAAATAAAEPAPSTSGSANVQPSSAAQPSSSASSSSSSAPDNASPPSTPSSTSAAAVVVTNSLTNSDTALCSPTPEFALFAPSSSTSSAAIAKRTAALLAPGLHPSKRAKLPPKEPSSILSSLASSSSNGALRPTAYRRMRSKSLPDGRALANVLLDPHYHHHNHAAAAAAAAASAAAAAAGAGATLHPSTPTTPPINIPALRELDLKHIVRNPQLRHDIVFDQNLNLAPNPDGRRARRKLRLADRYWVDVAAECAAILEGGQVDRAGKIPAVLTGLSDLISHVVPKMHRRRFRNVLDVDLTLQELDHGVFNFADFALWLSQLLKLHCAPMRDPWIDDMLALVQTGVATRNPTKLAEGLRIMFSIMETMKLDVANHHIRVLRPALVDAAVDFERDYLSQKSRHAKNVMPDAVKWYATVRNDRSTTITTTNSTFNQPSSSLDIFTAGLIQFFALHPSTTLPSTFVGDRRRICDFRLEAANITCLQQCVNLYRQLLGSVHVPTHTISIHDIDTLKSELLILVDTDNSDDIHHNNNDHNHQEKNGDAVSNHKWLKITTHLALQIARRVINHIPATASSGPSLSEMSNLAERWLIKNLSLSSPVFVLVHSRVLTELDAKVSQVIASKGSQWSGTNNSVAAMDGVLDRSVQSSAVRDVALNLNTLSSKIYLFSLFHWGVFGRIYLN